jgi:hypothetical protein
VGILAQRFGGEIGEQPTIWKVQGKGLLKITTGAAADCPQSTLERLSDNRPMEEAEENQDFVALSMNGACFQLLAAGEMAFRTLTGSEFR